MADRLRRSPDPAGLLLLWSLRCHLRPPWRGGFPRPPRLRAIDRLLRRPTVPIDHPCWAQHAMAASREDREDQRPPCSLLLLANQPFGRGDSLRSDRTAKRVTLGKEPIQ